LVNECKLTTWKQCELVA